MDSRTWSLERDRNVVKYIGVSTCVNVTREDYAVLVEWDGANVGTRQGNGMGHFSLSSRKNRWNRYTTAIAPTSSLHSWARMVVYAL